MKASWRKVLTLTVTAGLLLTACGQGDQGKKSTADGSKSPNTQELEKDMPEGAEFVNEYKATYLNDPLTLDYMQSNRDTTASHAVNFIEPLYETDQFGNYIPAAATDYEVSEDGLTWTYTLRQGVQWVDVDGNEYAEVKAQDFVTGLEHAVEVDSEALPMVSESIKNLRKFIDGEVKDFKDVGVKALDDYTLQYTLEKPEPYFNTKCTYGVMYPVNEEFLKSKGDNFGSLQPDSILYSGPYRLANLTAKSSIEYIKNDQYWDADNVHVEKVSLTYNDGSDLEAFFRMFKDDAIVSFSVLPNLPIYEEVKKEYGDSIAVNMPMPGSFDGQFNFNRRSYNVTKKETDKQKEDTQKAILNKNFRQAILFGFDRKAYMAQQVGDEFAAGRIRNTLVPGNFVNIGEKEYGEVLQDKLHQLSPEHFGDVDLADGQDAYYNPDKAKKVFAEAKEELSAAGVDFPIRIDLPILEQDEIAVNWGKSMKKTLEQSLGAENVVLDLNLLNQDNYYNATFNATSPDAIDYDISTASGWLPDFRDPSTYLNIFDPNNGELLISMGMESGYDKDKEAKEAGKIYDYGELYHKALDEVDDLEKRYEYFADAEALMLDNVLIVPINLQAAMPRVTRIIPFTAPFSFSGPTNGRYKFMRIQSKPVSNEQYDKLKKEWQAARVKANEEAAKEEASKFKGGDKKKDEKTEDKEKDKSEGEAEDKKEEKDDKKA